MTTSHEDEAGTSESVPSRTLISHAALAFVTAVTIVVLLHELSHVVAGLALGYSNTLFPFGVVHEPEPTTADAAITALTGPIFSLVTGLIAMVWQPCRARRGYGHLLWTWIAFVSVMEGVGYLVLTPFGIGDTGSVAAAYHAPLWLTIPIGALGVLGAIWLATRFAVPSLRQTDGELHSLRCYSFFPWIIGTLVTLALTGAHLTLVSEHFSDGDVFGVLMGTFALGVFAPMSIPFTTRARRRDPHLPGSEPLQLAGTPIAGIVLLALLVLLNALVLTRGITIG